MEAAPPPFSLNTPYQLADYRVGVDLSPILDLDASGVSELVENYGVHISNMAQVGSTCNEEANHFEFPHGTCIRVDSGHSFAPWRMHMYKSQNG